MKKITSIIFRIIIIAGVLFSGVNTFAQNQTPPQEEGEFKPAPTTACYVVEPNAYQKKGDLVTPDLSQEQCYLNYPSYGWFQAGNTYPELRPGDTYAYANCTTAATNLKDGWGWENGKSCKIDDTSIFLNCTIAATNLENGWGRENGKACKENFYYPLAPLTLDGTDGKFDPSQKNALGAYLNMMMKLIIGLASVMAVVMIVIGGVEYMTSDLVFSKESAKQRISEAVLGLLVALGAYALLNTINPDLLQTDLDTLDKVIVEVDLETPIISDVGTPPGKTTSCAEGIVKTTINMFACANIVQNINLLLSDSRAAKLNITGGGYRSYEEQKRLRIANCNGNFTSKEAFCKPLTALPGESNHNNGKAFDLRCDGQTIRTTDNKCYIWLTANASKYGLRNLNGEPWHWSVDGR